MAVTDDFNRANGALGANWAKDSVGPGIFSDLTIVSNACKGSVGGTHNVAVYTAGGTIAANQYAQVKVTATGGFIGTVLRSNGAGTFYVCYYSAGAATMYRWTGGGASNIATGTTITPAVNDVIYFEIVGSALTMKVNGVTVCTATDGTFTGAGYTGIDIYDNLGAVDDFEGGAVGSVSVSLTGVAADPQIGTGTITIGTGVVTPPVEQLVAGGRHWPWAEDEIVYLTGVVASPRIGSGTVRGLVEIPAAFEFPKPQPKPTDSSGIAGDLAKLKILAKRKPPEIAVELIPPPVPIKKPAVFVQLTGVEVARVEKVIERYEEEMLAFLDSL